MIALGCLVCLVMAPPDTPAGFASLAPATRQAMRLQRPIFVRVGGEDCPWCQKLETELRDAKLKEELARWVIVFLDSDKADEAELRSLGVGPIPALRLLTPTGRQVATADGYKDAEQLLIWLKKHFDVAANVPSEEQLGDGEPTPEAVQKLVATFKERDPSSREAAVRRLLAYPALAAVPVSEAFTAGPLQARLAALELLQEWKAPVGQIDPWQPETVTAERLKAVTSWASTVKPPPETTEPKSLTPEQLTTAKLDLDRLPQVNETESRAIRERLARFRSALLPEVTARLKDPPSDVARDRLMALRYRLVARDSLALTWPSGLDRLASSDAAQRHEALAELVETATSADEALLLELFASPDALVRELSLSALNARVGRAATTSLTRLLNDPEPNVRAAVLKQLTEKPSSEWVPQLTKFVAVETDPDLVVHAVRALAPIDSAAATRTLISLFTHASWRVRAEAAEAVGKKLGNHYGNRRETDSETEAAIIKLLDDEDGFVVGRALKVLPHVQSAEKNTSLIRLANRAPPELAAEAIGGVLVAGEAINSLKKFLTHAQPLVRAAAVQRLSTLDDDGREAIRTGLRDADSHVRIVAAEAVYAAYTHARNDYESQRARNASGESPRPVDVDTTLANVRRHRTWPTWPATMNELLRPLLNADSPGERVAAAMPFVAAGSNDEVLEKVLSTARANPEVISKASQALTWLSWSKRVDTYRAMLSDKFNLDQLSELVTALAHGSDKRGIPLYWDLAQRPDIKTNLADELVTLLEAAYPGQEKTVTVTDLKQHVESGPDAQRKIALTVLMSIDAEEASAEAKKILEDVEASKTLGRAALYAHLSHLPASEQTATAVTMLKHGDAKVRGAAALFLASGDLARISRVHYSSAYYVNSLEQPTRDTPTEARPFLPPEIPKLTAPPLKAMLTDQSPEVAAAAGYLLTLLGDASGFPAVVHQWRTHTGKDGLWTRLVSRAITAIDDDANVRLLEEIYRKLPADEFQVPEFYWTIRRLEGPNALRLRKQIRKEVGMERLRTNPAVP